MAVEQMVSEFRALRSSVIHFSARAQQQEELDDLQEMIRFNEAIDQGIAEPIATYAHEVQQSRDRFLAILGHDLRTPIDAMVTSTRFMLDTGELREPHRTFVSRMEAAARSMNRLVADVLEFTPSRLRDAIPVFGCPAVPHAAWDQVACQ